MLVQQEGLYEFESLIYAVTVPSQPPTIWPWFALTQADALLYHFLFCLFLICVDNLLFQLHSRCTGTVARTAAYFSCRTMMHGVAEKLTMSFRFCIFRVLYSFYKNLNEYQTSRLWIFSTLVEREKTKLENSKKLNRNIRT